MDGTVLLFYSYVTIEDPKSIVTWMRRICTEFGLTGRVFIAHEGINGTVGGSTSACQQYKQLMHEHPLFSTIAFKESHGSAACFNRLQVTVKKEIVAIKAPENTAAIEQTGTHLTPEEVHALLTEKPDDLIVLDTRNLYESAIGKFTDAIAADIQNFREFPDYIERNLDTFKDKQVLMYCTGGIRCERATAYLQEKQVAKNVYQIDGGIHMYAEKYPDGYFRGKNYVFDNRVALKVNDDILSTCSLCDTACDNYINCANAECNKHFIACSSCIEHYQETCSAHCHELLTTCKVKKRPVFKRIYV